MSLTPSICHSTSSHTLHTVFCRETLGFALYHVFDFLINSHLQTKRFPDCTHDHLRFGEGNREVVQIEPRAELAEKVKKRVPFVARSREQRTAFTSCSLKSYFLPRWRVSIWLYRCEGGNMWGIYLYCTAAALVIFVCPILFGRTRGAQGARWAGIVRAEDQWKSTRAHVHKRGENTNRTHTHTHTHTHTFKHYKYTA